MNKIRQRHLSINLERLENRVLLAADLIVSEINYNPYAPVALFNETIDNNNDDYEFIELLNRGDEPIDMEGVQFARQNIGGKNEGVDFVFTNLTLGPNERTVIVENEAAFLERYGDGVPVAGQWAGSLSNSSELLTLLAADGSELQQFTYRSSGKWPGRAGGNGAALEYKPDATDPNDPDSWRSTIEYGGTPGTAGGDRATRVVVNEVLAHTDLPQVDTVELRNLTTEPIDIGGWFLSDDIELPFRYAISEGSVIEPGGYFKIFETDFNPGQGTDPNDFALSEREDELWLISDDDANGPGRFEDHVEFAATRNGVSVGHIFDEVRSGDLQPLDELTLGEPNTGHFSKAAVVISEIQYHPLSNTVVHEFIELQNTTVFPIPLNDWRITAGVDVIIPDVIIPGSGVLVLVAFDPADETLATEFRNYYGIDESVMLVGPWDIDKEGNPDELGNGGEKLNLREPFDDVDVILYVGTDQVDYNDKAPWPLAADGQGGSLDRLSPSLYGNDPTSWIASVPSPGNLPIDVTTYPQIAVNDNRQENIGMDGELNRGLADVDAFRFNPSSDQSITITATGVGELPPNLMLRVFSTDGTEIAFSDNVADEAAFSEIILDVQSGQEYLVTVSGSSVHSRNFNPATGKGLAVSESTGDYELAIASEVANPFPYHNANLPEDVSGDGLVVAFDALLIINALNSGQGGVLPVPPENDSPFFDVTGNNVLEPLDALLVINFLNSNRTGVFAASIESGSDSADSTDDVDAFSTESSLHDLRIRGLAIDQIIEELDRTKKRRT